MHVNARSMHVNATFSAKMASRALKMPSRRSKNPPRALQEAFKKPFWHLQHRCCNSDPVFVPKPWDLKNQGIVVRHPQKFVISPSSARVASRTILDPPAPFW